MLTQAMPAVVRALQGTMPSAALKQLTQALGNCNQEVVQRGDVNVSPDAWTNVNNRNGAYNGDAWNPNDYRNLVTNGDLINNGGQNANQNAFDFSTRQAFETNSFYGGGIQNYAGNVNISNLYTENITTRKITVTGGGDGDPGDPGEPGPPGQPGIDGQGRAGFNGAPGFPGRRGRPDNQLVVVNVGKKKKSVRVLAGVTFDPYSCELHYAFTDINYLEDAWAEKELIRFLAP